MGCTSLSWPAVACGNDMMDIRMLGSESEKFATKVRIMVDELYFLLSAWYTVLVSCTGDNMMHCIILKSE